MEKVRTIFGIAYFLIYQRLFLFKLATVVSADNY